MFHGSIPSDVRNMAYEIVGGWQSPNVFVACSGNYTMERILAPLNKFKIHSNDIQIYSCAIGAYFAGQPLDLQFIPTFLSNFPFVEAHVNNPTDQLATLLIFSRLTSMMTPNAEMRQSPYYQRMANGIRLQFATMHEKTVTKIKNLKLQLASFNPVDAVDWVAGIPQDSAFISYPPFFGADKAYQRDFAKLDALCEWQRPSFEPITPERMAMLLSAATNRAEWLFASNHQLPDYEQYIVGHAQTTNRGVPIYIYASHAKTRIVTPHQNIVPVAIPRLSSGQTIGKVMSIHPITSPMFKALRSQYMNIFIRPGAESQAYAVIVDGKIIGVYAVSISPSPASYADMSSIYMLSDFPVAPTNYPRLAKLVLYAALSKEAQLLYERLLRHRVRRVSTTAFSNNPVSMKYRGLFTLHSRKEMTKKSWNKDGDNANPYYNQKYQLQYVAECGKLSLAESLAEWQKKHGQTEGTTHD
jgi:hypothetical protein